MKVGDQVRGQLAQFRRMRRLREQGFPYGEIGKRFGVSYGQARKVVVGEAWGTSSDCVGLWAKIRSRLARIGSELLPGTIALVLREDG